jgi:hypothetical protein
MAMTFHWHTHPKAAIQDRESRSTVVGTEQALIPRVIVAPGFLVQLAVQQGLTSGYDNQCEHCGQTFRLSPWSINHSAPLWRAQVRTTPSLRFSLMGLAGSQEIGCESASPLLRPLAFGVGV